VIVLLICQQPVAVAFGNDLAGSGKIRKNPTFVRNPKRLEYWSERRQMKPDSLQRLLAADKIADYLQVRLSTGFIPHVMTGESGQVLVEPGG
jgi:hypothetical protein